MKNRRYIYTLAFPLSLLAFSAYPAGEEDGGYQGAKDDENYDAGEYIDDATITAKIKTAILEESDLKSSKINVETSKGIVHLTGIVYKDADIKKAVEIAQNIEGVQAVKNNLKTQK